MSFKDIVCAAAGLLGGAVAWLFGGWTDSIIVLMVCLGIDYVTGLIVAGIFHASPKSETGGLESNAGWKGLARKVITLLLVAVANMCGRLIGTPMLRDVVAIAFCANEMISIIENAGLMGIPLPEALVKGIDALKKKAMNAEKEQEAKPDEKH